MPTAPAENPSPSAVSPSIPAEPEPALVRMAQAIGNRATIAQSLASAVTRRDRPTVARLTRELGLAVGSFTALKNELSLELGMASEEAKRLITQLLSSVPRADALLTSALQAQRVSSLNAWLELVPASPAEIADGLLEEPWLLRRDLVLLVGTGSLPFVDDLRARGQERIFTMDPSQAVCLPGPAGLPSVVNAHEIEDLETACWRFSHPTPENIRVHTLGGDLPASVGDISDRFERTLATVAQVHWETERFGMTFVRASGRNLPRIARHPSIHGLEGLFAGVPAVVVAAGPALDRNIHQLRELSGRVVIIAITQTLRALKKAGVRADIAMAVDPQNISYHLEGIEAGDYGTLVLGASVHPSLFDLPADSIFTFAPSGPCESWIYEPLGEHVGLASGGTVSTAGVHLALHLGCTPIVSIGRNLALDGSRYYASQAADGGQDVRLGDNGTSITLDTITSKTQVAANADEKKTMVEKLARNTLRLTQVRGWDGGTVTTITGFVYERDLLCALVRHTKHRALFVNASEAGAYIEGMEHLPLSEVLHRWGHQRIDVAGRLRQAYLAADVERRTARFISCWQATLPRLRRAQAAARAALALGAAPSPDDEDEAYPAVMGELRAQLRHLPVITLATRPELNEIERRDTQGWSSLAELNEHEAAFQRAVDAAAEEIAGLMQVGLDELTAQPDRA